MVSRRRDGQEVQVTCEDCFFARNGLCALDLDEPCPTFRPDHPDGLRPPSAVALRVPPGAPPPGRLGVPYAAQAGWLRSTRAASSAPRWRGAPAAPPPPPLHCGRAASAAPGVSVSPWARIEHEHAQRGEVEDPLAPRIASASTSSENVIVATPLGPNQAMNACTSRGRPRADQRDPDRDRPRDQQRDGDDRDRRPAVAEQPVERQQRAEHDEHAELDDLDDVVGAGLERGAQVGPRMPSVIAHTKTAISPLPSGGSPTATP